MSNKIDNPFLKQLITEIAGKTSEGRITDVSWTTLTEGKKKSKNFVTKEATKPLPKPAPEEEPAAEEPEAPAEPAPEAPAEPAAPAPKAKATAAPAPETPAEPAPEAPAPDEGGEDSDQAQADASKAKAELEKAKAEKDKAEKELKQQSYIKLGSSGGTQFLLSKVLDHAFKTNTIDALAGEMVQKLKIQTPEDFNSFSEDTAAFRVIPGMPELLAAMKALATKQPDTAPEETEPAA